MDRPHVRPYYDENGIKIFHGDARDLVGTIALGVHGCLVVDPPFECGDLMEWAAGLRRAESSVVFTDPRYIGNTLRLWGSPAWLFTWDTGAAWNLGRRRPLNRTRFAAWFGNIDAYRRDASLWGDAPPPRDHPTTKQQPLHGRRLTDLWIESLRWLHNGTAGSGSTGAVRFGGKTRGGDEAMRYAKPVGWLRCLIGNTSSGTVLDPFMGSGAALVAAKDLGREAVGIDSDEACCEFAAKRLAQGVLEFPEVRP